MDWLTDIHEAIDYIEANLLTVGQVADLTELELRRRGLKKEG